MSHIFISYSSQDKDYADRIAESLKGRGFDIWMDHQSIKGGARWFKEIGKGIKASSAFVVIMTPSSEDSEWVEKEILLAKRHQIPIFPLLLAGDEFEILIDLQHEDVRGGQLPSDRFFILLARSSPPNPNEIGQDRSPHQNETLSADEYCDRAYAAAENGDYETAIADYSRALELDPSKALTYNRRGNAYHNLGDYAAAIADYTQAIRLDPDFAPSYSNRASAQRSLGNDATAQFDYMRAIKLDPSFAYPHWGLGNIYYDQGQFPLALASYCRYLKLAGDNPSEVVVKRVAELGGCPD